MLREEGKAGGPGQRGYFTSVKEPAHERSLRVGGEPHESKAGPM